MTSPSQRFRKKPLEIEAYQLTEQKEIKTREGTLMGYPGDWIVTGIQGEIYPVGKEIFEMTYEPVDCSSHIPITDLDKVLDDYNGELLTKLVQELAGTWRMRDAKLFSIIRKYCRVPIGAMKELRKQEQP